MNYIQTTVWLINFEGWKFQGFCRFFSILEILTMKFSDILLEELQLLNGILEACLVTILKNISAKSFYYPIHKNFPPLKLIYQKKASICKWFKDALYEWTSSYGRANCLQCQSLIFCADGWLVKHESPKRYMHKTWEELEFKAAKMLHFMLITIWQLEWQINSNNHLHISKSKF